MRGHFSLAGQQEADISDAQGVETLCVQSTAVGQEHAVSRRTSTRGQTSRAAVGRGLDDVPILFQLLFTLIKNPADQRGT